APPNTSPIARALSAVARGDVTACVWSHIQAPASSSSITIIAMTVRLRFDISSRPFLSLRRTLTLNRSAAGISNFLEGALERFLLVLRPDLDDELRFRGEPVDRLLRASRAGSPIR